MTATAIALTAALYGGGELPVAGGRADAPIRAAFIPPLPRDERWLDGVAGWLFPRRVCR